MSDNWTIEAHDTTGKTVFFRPAVDFIELQVLIPEILAEATTGGVVIYRAIVVASNKKVGDDHGVERHLGLVTKDGVIEDGFGGAWIKCSPTCDLQVVRPGKVQCSCAGELVAGGNKSLSYCRYCQITGGHDADCVVIS